MDTEAVLKVLEFIRAAGLRVWVDGGWGVEALLGRVTRSHDDLDLVVAAEDCDGVVHALRRAGYDVEADERPERVVLIHPQQGRVDLHVVTFDSLGNATSVQLAPSVLYPGEGFVEGSILGTQVLCISAEVQLLCRLPHDLSDKHHGDVAALCEAYALEVPAVWLTD